MFKQEISEELTNQSNVVFNFNSSLAKSALKTNQTHILIFVQDYAQILLTLGPTIVK